MKDIRVQIGSVLTKDKHNSLIEFFQQQCGASSWEEQVTYHYEAPVEAIIQKKSTFSRLVTKKGSERVELRFNRDDFGQLENMFKMFGYPIKVKWFRKRHTFQWRGFDIFIDDKRGYGMTFSMSKKSDAAGQAYATLEMQKSFKDLDLEVTPKDEFDKKYQNYMQNWKAMLE
ncbi:hypothetical protein HQ545_00730 [Candidatus Woesearchaeota archaeon]|nr:hypothetical protein [Candidatus Woesearchaeota archaeon]